MRPIAFFKSSLRAAPSTGAAVARLAIGPSPYVRNSSHTRNLMVMRRRGL
jgi:hypothetical protein